MWVFLGGGGQDAALGTAADQAAAGMLVTHRVGGWGGWGAGGGGPAAMYFIFKGCR